MRSTLHLLASLAVLKAAHAAPAKERRAKQFSYLDYAQPEVDYNAYNIDHNAYNIDNNAYGIDNNAYGIDNDDYVAMALEENDLGRTVPPKPLVRPQHYNSPIYYIRLPPQPYMFVPGLGYMSQPAPPPVSPFVNLPLSFVANGKPSNVYQWSGTFHGFPAPSKVPPKPKKPLPDSTIHRLPGTFSFNGKPEDVFVLRDSYNSLLNDVLQNVYP